MHLLSNLPNLVFTTPISRHQRFCARSKPCLQKTKYFTFCSTVNANNNYDNAYVVCTHNK